MKEPLQRIIFVNGSSPQVSGQAPYCGQVSWFTKFHPEQVQSAIDRYVSEIHRVTGVIKKVLSDKEKALGDPEKVWLIENKCTYTELSFVAWQRWGPRFGGDDLYTKFPKTGAWMKRMESRPSVEKIYKDQDKADEEVKGKI